jgi:hypothetical protein
LRLWTNPSSSPASAPKAPIALRAFPTEVATAGQEFSRASTKSPISRNVQDPHARTCKTVFILSDPRAKVATPDDWTGPLEIRAERVKM